MGGCFANKRHFSKSGILTLTENQTLTNTIFVDEIRKRLKIKTNFHFDYLYSGRENHGSADIFHKKCDGKKNTVLIVYSAEKTVFGGFTCLPWASSQLPHQQIEQQRGKGEASISFVFRIYDKEMQFFNAKPKSTIIINYSLMGPIFGNNDIHIGDKATQQATSWCNFGASYAFEGLYGSKKASLFLPGGSQIKFKVRQYQVWQLVVQQLNK